MQVGIGLPATIPAVQGPEIATWARAAEASGFSSLGVIDRLQYDNLDPLVSLAAAAAVTDRIGLVTTVLLGPLRRSAVLAKQAASIDRISGGRLTLGLGVGNRPGDYDAAGADFHRRGKLLEQQLLELHAVWEGAGGTETVGPRPDALPARVVLGGASVTALDRAARLAAGWIFSGVNEESFGAQRHDLLLRWKEHGRAGEPRVLALSFFALGANGRAEAELSIRRYYGYAPFVEGLLESVAYDNDDVAEKLDRYGSQGCDELLLFPCSADPRQVHLLAGAASL